MTRPIHADESNPESENIRREIAMEVWRFIDLEEMPPVQTQAVYHAVASKVNEGASPDTIIFCTPKTPLVSIGYHQEAEAEVDLEYCRIKGVPVVRRILGGGAVYLDSGQLFYQIVASKSNPKVPGTIQQIFQRFLEAPVKTYNDIGIPAIYRPINDIEVGGRKISGNGATEVGGTIVLTGNIIFDFNFDEMVRILRVPNEKFRDKVSKTLRERLTTIRKELDEPPNRDDVKELLKRNYEYTLGVELVEGNLTVEEENLMESISEKYQTREWLHLVENDHMDLIKKRSLKISGRTVVGEAVKKTEGGLLRVLIETKDMKIEDIMITGDFFFIPRDYLHLLERSLRGVDVEKGTLINNIRSFYEMYKVSTPGMTVEEIAEVILSASSR
ncbi:MAG: lipoate--protein ligase [Candidatus Bathyarchaeia archaeon]